MDKNISDIPSDATPQQILWEGIKAAQGPVSLACSFSLEDVIIIDMAHERGLEMGIFALDTGRLNEETYEVADAICERYNRKIDWYFPRNGDVEELERSQGLFSFRQSLEKRHQCCRVRKVEPLSRALTGLAGWVTGMRREQSVTRGDLSAIEHDDLNGGILKINPLLAWSEEQVMDYTADHRLPKNRLFSQGYRSIGCAPCTRAVLPGEDARAGRWWWENPEHKECGLHKR
jgi:phosphoadenosine phosphosulfate reductase